MSYRVRFTKEALKELKKLDKHTALLITAWVRKNLEGCADPRQHGKGLAANSSGQWHYRVGKYRLIAEIQDNEVVILTMGDRREVMERNQTL